MADLPAGNIVRTIKQTREISHHKEVHPVSIELTLPLLPWSWVLGICANARDSLNETS